MGNASPCVLCFFSLSFLDGNELGVGFVAEKLSFETSHPYSLKGALAAVKEYFS